LAEISAEEFAAWRDDPVTEVVLKAFDEMALKQREGWLSASWDGDACDPLLLIELKTRADAYRAVCECTFEDITGETE
jgi:hypothetical protein